MPKPVHFPVQFLIFRPCPQGNTPGQDIFRPGAFQSRLRLRAAFLAAGFVLAAFGAGGGIFAATAVAGHRGLGFSSVLLAAGRAAGGHHHSNGDYRR